VNPAVLHRAINGFCVLRGVERRPGRACSAVLLNPQQFVRENQDLLFARRCRTIERNCWTQISISDGVHHGL